MTARGPNGQVASNSGALTLFGSKATDATSPSLQPLPGGGIMAKVDIPINVDWAESSVTFSVETSQGVGGDNPNWESCRTPQENVDLNLTVCSEPLWENSATLTGPDLSAVNAGITLPAAIDKTEFALFVLPAMEFQLPVLPVAIVYAPLGNGKSALPTYQITTTTASNMQIGNAQTTTTTLIRDDKTTYSGSVKGTDLETIDNKTSSGMFGSTTITLAGTWDNTEENDTQSGSGSTAQIINSQDLSTTFSVAATTTLDLTKIDYNTQPFWHDLIIGVVNPQFALWDYPGGHLIQPIGSVTTVGIPLQQLVSCITNRATKTETPNADNLPHFPPFAGPPSEGATRYVWMSSEDCRNIASLDQYYKKGTQSATPLAFRQLFGGNASLAGNSSLTVSSKQTTQLVAGQNSSAVETVKITAARTTTLTAAQEASVYIPDLFLKLTGTATGSWSNQLIEGNSTQVSFSTQDSNTLQSQTTATTILQDTSGLGVPVNVLQDSIFQGIAVQDTDMHYQSERFRRPPPVEECLNCANGLKAVQWDDFRSQTRKNQKYVVQSPFGDYVVRRPSSDDASRMARLNALERLRIDAARQHITRRVPAPGPVTVAIVERAEALQLLSAVKNPIVRNVIDGLRSRPAQ